MSNLPIFCEMRREDNLSVCERAWVSRRLNNDLALGEGGSLATVASTGQLDLFQLSLLAGPCSTRSSCCGYQVLAWMSTEIKKRSVSLRKVTLFKIWIRTFVVVGIKRREINKQYYISKPCMVK